jgi:hypothetical protein
MVVWWCDICHRCGPRPSHSCRECNSLRCSCGSCQWFAQARTLLVWGLASLQCELQSSSVGSHPPVSPYKQHLHIHGWGSQNGKPHCWCDLRMWSPFVQCQDFLYICWGGVTHIRLHWIPCGYSAAVAHYCKCGSHFLWCSVFDGLTFACEWDSHEHVSHHHNQWDSSGTMWLTDG